MSDPRITLYGRPGCHLCDEAEARIREIAPDQPISVVNIELDDELHARYLERIPVILVDGRQIAELVRHRKPSFADLLIGSLSA